MNFGIMNFSHEDLSTLPAAGNNSSANPEAIADLQFWIDHPSLDSIQLQVSGETSTNLKHDIDAARGLLERFERHPLELLGVGAFGIVFRARDRRLKRDVAIKLLRKSMLNHCGNALRFSLEAESMALCAGQGVVPIYDFGTLEDTPYISMQFIEGLNLRQHLGEQGGPLPPRQAAGLIGHVSRAVHGMHQHGVLHRDLKPSNVLLERQSASGGSIIQPWVADFGFVKGMPDATHGLASDLSTHDTIVGTLSYMSPEQAAGQPKLTTATDVYALGVILYELLVGHCPFTGNNKVEVLGNILRAQPTSLRKQNAGVPRELEAIVMKCLEKHPNDRYASAEALAIDLECWLQRRPTLATPPTPVARLRMWASRNRLAAASLSTIGLGLPLALLVLSTLYARERATSKQLREARHETQVALVRAQESAESFVRLARKNIRKLAEEYGKQPGGALRRLQLHQEVLTEFETMAKAGNYDAYSRHQLSIALHYVSTALGPAGFSSESTETRQRGLQLLEELVEEYPDNDAYRFDRFYNRMVLSTTSSNVVSELEKCLADVRLVCEHQPQRHEYANALNSNLASLSLAYLAPNQPPATHEQIEQTALRAIHQAEDLQRQHPDKVEYLKPAREGYRVLGILCSQRNQVDRMLENFHTAFQIHQKISDAIPNEGVWLQEGFFVRIDFLRALKAHQHPLLAENIQLSLAQLDRMPEWRLDTQTFDLIRSTYHMWLATEYCKSSRLEDAQLQYELGLRVNRSHDQPMSQASMDFQAFIYARHETDLALCEAWSSQPPVAQAP